MYLVFSPRTWGCFRPCGRERYHRKVFPTHVGVFLTLNGAGAVQVSFPHARGGVSNLHQAGLDQQLFSPRTWGCFCVFLVDWHIRGVFPTHVGVFLTRLCVKRIEERFPHARGGVSTGCRTQRH